MLIKNNFILRNNYIVFSIRFKCTHILFLNFAQYDQGLILQTNEHRVKIFKKFQYHKKLDHKPIFIHTNPQSHKNTNIHHIKYISKENYPENVRYQSINDPK